MGIIETQTSTHSMLRACRSIEANAHAYVSGVLAVQGRSTTIDTAATGDFPVYGKSRLTTTSVRLQPTVEATPGIGLSAAQGSLKPEMLPQGAPVSGVPPRSKPV